MPPKVASLAKDVAGRIALIAGSTVSGTAVLGTSVLSGVAKVSAAVLEAQNTLVDEVGHNGIRLAGQTVESLINVSIIT